MIDLRTTLEAVPVTGLTAVRVRVPFRRPFATATGMWLHREAWILFVAGPDGRIGVGEAVLEPDATEVEETLLARLIREAADRARSGDVPDVEELELLGTPGRAFRAAIDAARFDLLPAGDGEVAGAAEPGRVGVPTADRTIPPGVPVNGTIGFGGPAAGAEAALQAIEAGFTTLKLKAGVERETVDLVARVRAIRTAVGPDVRLRLDVNGAWDLPTAEERLEAVARFGIEHQLAERPVRILVVAAFHLLRRFLGVALCGPRGGGLLPLRKDQRHRAQEHDRQDAEESAASHDRTFPQCERTRVLRAHQHRRECTAPRR